jgi:hypothetical protein
VPPPPAPGEVFATDYASPVELEFTEVQIQGEGPDDIVIIRTWIATDPCGNSTQDSYSIYWIPDTGLECDINVPEDIECNMHGVVITSDVTGGIGGDLKYTWEVIGNECFIQSGQGTPEVTIYVGFGEVTVKLTVMDEFGCMTMCDTTFDCLNKIEIGQGGLIQDGQIQPIGSSQSPALDSDPVVEDLQLWPNPTSDELNIAFNAFSEQEVEMYITNVLGSIVWTSELDAMKGVNRVKIDVGDWSSGSYLVYFYARNQVITKIIVVNN